ncbi:MAG: BCCT family transporter [Pseudomonadales bacterium]|nr:BCCT family transporter [Pseudomonadales bacterium]NRA16896.1 BCCT family transporter [Oceanospirillaceae bacterium]
MTENIRGSVSTVPEEEQVEHQLGQDNVQLLGLDIHNPVFGISAGLILFFVVATLMFPEASTAMLGGAKSWSINHFDWLFMIGGNLFVLFCIAMIFLPVGKIRLGGKNATAEFSRVSWLAMLFAAGMGIGLMFWSVAEPVAYYTDWYGTPLNAVPNTPEGASMALGATMFHWGLHPWAIYGVVALSLAFFTYNRGLPLTIRSAFYPILGNRVWGPIGHAIDVLAVLATMFGLATSLGLGAQQATSGLSHLFGIENTINTQIAVIVAVTAVALISVTRGLDGGVKLLSNINMCIAAVLLAFVAIAGSLNGFFNNFIMLIGSYAENIIPLSNWIDREDSTWYHGWTVFYWAWWVSWSPFVGMFIARISKGRTVRELMIAVLVIPTLLSAVWMSAFGGNALDQIQNNVGELTKGVGDVSLTMFHMLAEMPMAEITSVLAIILVLVFFITSSDSGSLVIDSITAGGKVNSPVAQRVFWAIMQGLIAGVLLFGGGADALKALQAGAITAGLPFTAILILMCFSLYKGLNQELKKG